MTYSVTIQVETKPNADNIAFQELREYTVTAQSEAEAGFNAAQKAYHDPRVACADICAIEPA